MNTMFVLADLYAQGSLHRRAHSARPDAPIQPVTPRRRFPRLRRGHQMPVARNGLRSGPSPGLTRRRRAVEA